MRLKLHQARWQAEAGAGRGFFRLLQGLQAQRAQLKGQVAALQAKADHIEEIVTQAEPRTRCGAVGGWVVRVLDAPAWPCLPPANARCSAHGPRRHQLSLYAHVSKITWQFDRPTRVAGTVSTPSQLRPFDFDPAATPDFEIVNQLWEMMGTDD